MKGLQLEGLVPWRLSPDERHSASVDNSRAVARLNAFDAHI